jgi:hypothetical protein
MGTRTMPGRYACGHRTSSLLLPTSMAKIPATDSLNGRNGNEIGIGEMPSTWPYAFPEIQAGGGLYVGSVSIVLTFFVCLVPPRREENRDWSVAPLFLGPHRLKVWCCCLVHLAAASRCCLLLQNAIMQSARVRTRALDGGRSMKL